LTAHRTSILFSEEAKKRPLFSNYYIRTPAPPSFTFFDHPELGVVVVDLRSKSVHNVFEYIELVGNFVGNFKITYTTTEIDDNQNVEKPLAFWNHDVHVPSFDWYKILDFGHSEFREEEENDVRYETSRSYELILFGQSENIDNVLTLVCPYFSK
jgi:hypothetical protein